MRQKVEFNPTVFIVLLSNNDLFKKATISQWILYLKTVVKQRIKKYLVVPSNNKKLPSKSCGIMWFDFKENQIATDK